MLNYFCTENRLSVAFRAVDPQDLCVVEGKLRGDPTKKHWNVQEPFAGTSKPSTSKDIIEVVDPSGTKPGMYCFPSLALNH